MGAFGWLGQRIGAKPGILIGIAVYLAALVYAWHFLQDEGDFYVLAVAIGLVQGVAQSLFGFVVLVRCALGVEIGAGLLFGAVRAQQRTVLHVLALVVPRFADQLIPGEQRGS